ncbi:MAG: hypothetical protein M3Q07_00740 [Pseudobdellovibrionaceae bacterium]|nr:hypothetical protein [Pseudobdellovibrionaceae bacterium]
MKFSCIIMILLWAFTGCKKSSSSDDPTSLGVIQASLSKQFFQTSSAITVEVWYEEAAAPYTKKLVTDRDIWDILRQNLNAIMQYRAVPPSITVPSLISEMNLLSIATQENWTSEQLQALAAQNKTGTPEAGTSMFYIYFLNGYFNKGAGSDKNVLGVSLGGTNIIAMFKPVIQSTATGVAEIVPKFVEQSTLVHEMGHALGFVNNGVPMVSNYQDQEHGAHSNNEDDVMYWLNEGASDLKNFVLKYVNAQSLVMWGPEVLADAKAISK